MKVFHLPETIGALIFDMDLTLYTSPEYGKYQIDCLIGKIAEIRGLSFDEMNREIDSKKKEWERTHGGKKPSLSNILATYGISMEENIRWREEIYEPEKFIKEDPRLRQTLEKLRGNFKLGVITNNPVSVARKTLASLGVAGLLPVIVGLDTCMCPKPHEKPFLEFLRLTACESENCVSIGDRYDIDLVIPLEMGMGAILVDGVEDVYELPDIIYKH